MKTIEDIEIEVIKEFLPGLLVNKFSVVGLKTLGQIPKITPDEFLKIRGTGKKSLTELKLLQERIINNPKEFLDYHDSITKIHVLPINTQNQYESPFQQIEEAILDYINLLKKGLYKGTLLYYYGLNGNKFYTLDEIGTYYDVTRERVRQIKDSLLKEIGVLLKGDFIDSYKCQLHKSLSTIIKQLNERLLSLEVFTLKELKDILSSEFGYQVNSKNEGLISLLVESLNMEFAGKVESNFTKAQFIFCNGTNKGEYLDTARKTLDVFQTIVLPITEMDAIIEVKRIHRNLKNVNIKNVINSLPEIEILSSGNQTFYQVTFESLSNARDRAFRILKERGSTMYIDDIVSEINHRLASSDTSKVYDRFSLALATDPRFKPKQKTGYWDLAEWNTNRDRIEDLVKKALHTFNQPTSADDIVNHIKKDRPQLKETSIRALIGRDCLKVEGDKFILPEWRQRYPSLAFAKRKQRINTKEPERKTLLREQIIRYLNTQSDLSDEASNIIKSVLPINKDFKRQAFYKIFEEAEYFNKVEENGELKIQLVQTTKDIVLSTDKYNWLELKGVIIREIGNEIKRSSNYTNSLEDILDLLYTVISLKTKETGLNGIADRIFPSLSKLYLEVHNRTDKLNLMKQLLSLTDSLLKKILYLTNATDYIIVKKNNKGLGGIMDKLPRIDPTKERYKSDINAVPDSGVKRHLFTVYTSRNNDIHNADDLSEIEIIKIATSCLIFYTYSIGEYFEELTLKIRE